MIKLRLDWRDYLYALEGFARGSHLRQHIWKAVVEKHIPQMSDEERDNVWYYLRRDVWPIYFCGDTPRCGDEDFLHALAAMHRGNWATISVKFNRNAAHELQCYRFGNRWYPARNFSTFISKRYEVTAVIRYIDVPHSEFQASLPTEHIIWWQDLEVYNLPLDEIRKRTKGGNQ